MLGNFSMSMSLSLKRRLCAFDGSHEGLRDFYNRTSRFPWLTQSASYASGKSNRKRERLFCVTFFYHLDVVIYTVLSCFAPHFYRSHFSSSSARHVFLCQHLRASFRWFCVVCFPCQRKIWNFLFRFSFFHL